MIEVEFKFSAPHTETLRNQLEQLGAVAGQPTRQRDEYFQPGLQDFRAEQRALRIRETETAVCLTYKGPHQHAAAKIREEIEVRLDRDERDQSDQRERLANIWLRCGFQPLGVVEKTRVSYECHLENVQVEICLDAISGLGEFVELERIVDDPQEISEARTFLEHLAVQLGLAEPIRESYLELWQSRSQNS